MPTESRIWRGQDAFIQDFDDAVVGVLQNWTLSVEYEFEDLTGAGSPKRQDDQKTFVEVQVDAEWGEWNENGYKAFIDYDEAQDQLSESSDVPHFDVTFEIPDKDDAFTMNPTDVDVRFPSVELSADPDSWVTLNVSGEGADLTGLAP